MEIDAFTLVAQLFNFALLVWILRRVLYRPIREAMKAREETVAGRLASAAQEKEAAEELATQYRDKLRDLDAQSDDLIAQARARADELGVQLSHALNERITEREREWRATQSRRAEHELAEFRAGVRNEILSTLRTILGDLADENLERRMTRSFLTRIEALTDEQVATLIGSETERIPLHVFTTHTLADPERADIRARLAHRFGQDVALSFEVDESRVAGIELRARGHVLGWSVADYLDTLDAAVRVRIDELARESDGVAA